jgi:hypothetical protein
VFAACSTFFNIPWVRILPIVCIYRFKCPPIRRSNEYWGEATGALSWPLTSVHFRVLECVKFCFRVFCMPSWRDAWGQRQLYFCVFYMPSWHDAWGQRQLYFRVFYMPSWHDAWGQRQLYFRIFYMPSWHDAWGQRQLYFFNRFRIFGVHGNVFSSEHVCSRRPTCNLYPRNVFRWSTLHLAHF